MTSRPGRAVEADVDQASLNVLLALEPGGGGVGRHVIDLAEGLLRRRHRVSLIHSPTRAEPAFRARLGELGGADLHAVPMRRALGPDDVRQLAALRALIRDRGPFDVLHAHSSKAGGLLRLALIGNPAPCVYTPHAFVTLDPELAFLPRLVYGTAERLLARLCHRVICVSRQERDHALSLGIPDERLTTIHNGIGPLAGADRLSIRRELGLAESTICIGTVGRLSYQKAVDRLIDAYSLSEASRLDTRLVIVGEGPDLALLRELTGRIGLDGRVLVTGAADGARLMAAFDIFALSSRYEAFPYVLLEAAARGLPIVMAETGGANSIIKDMQNGFIVPQNDPRGFAEKLDWLVREPALRRKMAERSRELAADYSVDRMVEQTIEVYRQAIRQAAQSRPQ